jgi:signal transduction histidine kinase/predicted CoA-binding protein
MYEFLRKVPLFAELPDEDLERLCQMINEVRLEEGQELFSEGSPGDKAYVIKEGQIEIFKRSGGRNILLAVRQPGEVIGEMSMLEASSRNASGRARAPSLLLEISHEQLENLFNTSPSAARAMLYTITSRLRTTELLLRESEKLAQLGTLTAGITHELNNPAAATRRGAGQLQEALADLQQAHLNLGRFNLTEEQETVLLELDQLAQQRASQPEGMDSLERSDREYELETWLEAHGSPNAWELAPSLVNLGYRTEQLELLSETFSAEEWPVVIAWLGATSTTYNLLEEIHQGATRISDIVKSLKSYVYLDQAPVQEIDIHESLDNTLIMLRSKLKEGVNVRRDYAQDVPKIQAFGSELNQVWTNIIDNAIDAMDGKGELLIRSYYEKGWVHIEIEDNGPGIPPEIQDRIFSPFFTTKPVGKGTGLGLNISYEIVNKHAGEIKLFSKPGKTCFQVILPVNFEEAKSGAVSMVLNHDVSDEKLRHILETTRTIAVVGINDKQDRPAYSVPTYLQSQGYRILPVNPKLSEVLGERAFPDLTSLEEPVDVVLIFRRSENVPPIVEQAIQIGAKVVWMQEGIVHQAAAESARRAGLEVVMDTCMRATHRRLINQR